LLDRAPHQANGEENPGRKEFDPGKSCPGRGQIGNVVLAHEEKVSRDACKKQVKDLWNASEGSAMISRMQTGKKTAKPRTSRPPKGVPQSMRSPCAVAKVLDIVGDRWSLLIVRDLFRGMERFKDFAGSPEGIPTNILSDRLERLALHGVIEQTPAADGTKRLAYKLTEKGRALGPVLVAMRDWGLKWEEGTEVFPSS
jgi:DNA-binding HxlR family transcriptional regulator